MPRVRFAREAVFSRPLARRREPPKMPAEQNHAVRHHASVNSADEYASENELQIRQTPPAEFEMRF